MSAEPLVGPASSVGVAERSGADWLQVQAPLVQLAPDAQGASVQGVPSGTGVPVQLPLESHASFCTHELPLLHEVPAAASASPHAPLFGSQVETLHGPDGVQLLPVPTQRPFWQVALSWHLSGALHALPFGLLDDTHAPVEESHAPTVHGPFRLEQSFGVPEQVPFEQVPAPLVLHRPPHDPPVSGVELQFPFVGSQVGGLWQSWTTHDTGGPATHAPLLQTFGWQKSVVLHWVLSAIAVPVQAPPVHLSLLVHGFLSSQVLLFGGWVQAPPAQTSLVQGFPSSVQAVVF
jgi:hypothetical protein